MIYFVSFGIKIIPKNVTFSNSMNFWVKYRKVFSILLIEGEKLELKGSCFYNLKPSLFRMGGMLFQRHRKECEKDYTQISWCLNCYRVSNGASFSLVKQKNFWYCFVRPEVERILIMILLSSEMALKEIWVAFFQLGRFPCCWKVTIIQYLRGS